MSARKLENDVQRSHTEIPRPPYMAHLFPAGLLQRETIRIQLMYVGDVFPTRLWPCVAFWVPRSARRQPHDLVFPLRTFFPIATVSLPHSHRQTQVA